MVRGFHPGGAGGFAETVFRIICHQDDVRRFESSHAQCM